jgi:mono/diheme cytochrome c family protein
MIKRLLLGIVALVVIAVVGLFVLAWRSAIAPITPPPAAAFAPDLVAQGQALAGAGYCANCHTAPGGQPYAGGYAMATPFGTLYSSNITPDPDTGIGRWSEAAFRRAMRDGVARDGSHLFPAFPYQHFNLVTDEDLHALYAYLMTRPAVQHTPPKPDIPFPLNVRALQAGWKLLFFRDGAFAPKGDKSPEWERGAYLAEGLGHCSACHSPRNGLGAEKMGSHRYAGAPIDDWYAPALTTANPAPVAWTTQEIYDYLHQGGTALHGVAAGPMAPVVRGLARLPDADVHAIAVYVADRMGGDAKAAGNDAALAQAMARAHAPADADLDPGAHLYAAACASCHYNRGPMPLAVRPELGLNSALTSPDPSSLIQVILHGMQADDGLHGLVMPAYAHALSDEEIAQLAAWLRRTQTDQPAWPDLPAKVAALRHPGGTDK